MHVLTACCPCALQAANRVNFNQPEEEFLDGDDVVGLGVLGKEGSGRLRIQVRALALGRSLSFIPSPRHPWCTTLQNASEGVSVPWNLPCTSLVIVCTCCSGLCV